MVRRKREEKKPAPETTGAEISPDAVARVLEIVRAIASIGDDVAVATLFALARDGEKRAKDVIVDVVIALRKPVNEAQIVRRLNRLAKSGLVERVSVGKRGGVELFRWRITEAGKRLVETLLRLASA